MEMPLHDSLPVAEICRAE